MTTKKLKDELEERYTNVSIKEASSELHLREVALNFIPNLIFSDFYLLDSPFLNACLEIHAETPVVLLGNNESNGAIMGSLDMGFSDYVDVNQFDRLPIIIHRTLRDHDLKSALESKYEELNKVYLTQRMRSAKLHAINEEERFNLAREIHDELGQVLSALKIDVSMLGRQIFNNQKIDKVEARGDYDEIIRRLERLTSTVKSILADLRPEILDELGVIEAIRWLVDKYKKDNNIKFDLSLPDVLNGDRIFPITLYRIVQATLTNIVRHTDATLVTISLKVQKEMLLLTIVCDGVEISKNEYKLMNVEIRERVGFLDGKLEIGSRKPKGKKLKATIPFGKQLRMRNYDKSYYSR